MATRNHAVDALRAVAVLYIVGYWHLFNYIPGFPSYANLYTNGLTYILLGTFTFASGYLLAGRPLRPGVVGIMAFYYRRLVRIYPLYAVALLLFWGAGLTDQSVTIKALLLISMFTPPAPPTLWFITMIMSFYLLAPVLIKITARPWLFLVTCGLILLVLLSFSLIINPIDLRMFMYFPAFALGVMLARYPEILSTLYSLRLLLAILIAPFLFLFSLGTAATVPLAPLYSEPLILVGTLVLFIYSKIYIGAKQNQYILFISYSSFCMYLFHRLIYKYVQLTYFPDNPIIQIVYMLIFGLGITIFLSYLIQKSYDWILTTLEQTYLEQT